MLIKFLLYQTYIPYTRIFSIYLSYSFLSLNNYLILLKSEFYSVFIRVHSK